MLNHLGLKASAVVGTTGVVAQTVATGDVTHIWERLGVAGILVAGAYLMLRYFMAVVTEKDKQIAELFERQEQAAAEHTSMLITHLEKGYDVQRGMTHALHELTGVVRQIQLREERR